MSKGWAVIRYSTAKQGENSVERQWAAIESWSNRFGIEIVGCSMDLETSRTTEHSARPGLMEAISQVKTGVASVLIAESVSRIGDNGILHAVRKELRKHGKVSVTSDSGSDMDEDMQEMAAIFSKVEIRQLRQRTKGALDVKKMRGERVGSIPYGKRLRADGVHVWKLGRRACAEGCRGCFNLEDEPEEMKVVLRVKELSDKMGPFQIARVLKDEGFVSRTGKPFVHVQCQRMLAS